MDYKDTWLGKGGNHKGIGQVNDTNIEENWTPQYKYNGWQYKNVQYKWTSKRKFNNYSHPSRQTNQMSKT